MVGACCQIIKKRGGQAPLGPYKLYVYPYTDVQF